MKRHLINWLSLLLLSLILVGCGQNSGGPHLTKKVLLPLLIRAKDTQTPANSSEILLGNGVNGIGEPGLNLTNANTYTMPPQNWVSNALGYTQLQLNAISNIDLSAGPNGDNILPVPVATPDFIFQDQSYVSVTLSGNSNNKNRISITLVNSAAGSTGLTVAFLENGSPKASVFLSPGQTSGILSLTGLSLSPADPLKLQISGSINKNPGAAAIGFVASAFEISAATINSASVNQNIDYGLLTNNFQFNYDLPDTPPLVQLSLADLKLTPTMPANLVVDADLIITPKDSTNTTIPGKTKTIHITLNANQEQTISILAAINDVLAARPSHLQFSLQNYQLSGNGGNVTVDHTSTISIGAAIIAGLDTVQTNPLGINTDKLDVTKIQSAQIVLDINNHSPVGLIVNVKLYPDNDANPNNTPPSPVPSDIFSFAITIAPNADRTSTIVIPATELTRLTQNGTVYHQIGLTNTSGAGTIDANSYIEIHSRAEVDLIIN